jgi:hypothetical protein
MREAAASWWDPYEWEHIDVSSLTSLTLRPQDGDETQIPDEVTEPVMPARVFVPFSADPKRQFDARLQGQMMMKRRGPDRKIGEKLELIKFICLSGRWFRQYLVGHMIDAPANLRGPSLRGHKKRLRMIGGHVRDNGTGKEG